MAIRLYMAQNERTCHERQSSILPSAVEPQISVISTEFFT